MVGAAAISIVLGLAPCARCAEGALQADVRQERQLLELGEGSRAGEVVDGARLGALLPERTALVAYRSVDAPPPVPGEPSTGEALLVADVLRRDGAHARVELGGAAEIEALAAAWRAALGAPFAALEAPFDGSRVRAARAEELRRGAALRERLVDPVLAAAGPVRTLLVDSEGALSLVPLDALPAAAEGGARGGEDERLGDRLRIALAPSLGLLGSASGVDPANRRLVALGGPDYGAPEEGAPRRFAPLAGAERELASVEKVHLHSFVGERVVLRGAAATRAALVELAPGARYLHLAAWVWLADEEPGLDPRAGCGLALAGASRDPRARISAEELAALDLSACSLAALTACEPRAGPRAAARGLRALREALHAAGVRTLLLPLWRTDEATTRELVERFYVALWWEKTPPADALWRAKRELRASGAPPRDWAGWVLSGEPD